MHKLLKPYILARFEPTIFSSGDGDDDHDARTKSAHLKSFLCQSHVCEGKLLCFINCRNLSMKFGPNWEIVSPEIKMIQSPFQFPCRRHKFRTEVLYIQQGCKGPMLIFLKIFSAKDLGGLCTKL
jgi:hypothetical protein